MYWYTSSTRSQENDPRLQYASRQEPGSDQDICRGLAITPPSPTGEGAPTEAPPEGPDGGALPEAHFHAI